MTGEVENRRNTLLAVANKTRAIECFSGPRVRVRGIVVVVRGSVRTLCYGLGPLCADRHVLILAPSCS